MTSITIIGAGPGGYVAAIRAAQLGAEVIVVEKEELGGTCLNWGCIPSKALLESARVIQTIKDSKRFGIEAEIKNIDFSKIQARKDLVVKQLRSGIEALFKKNNIKLVRDEARILDKNTVDAGGSEINPDYIIIAIGSHANELPFLKIDHKNVLSSKDLLQSKGIPEQLIVLGAGAEGLEFASMFSDFGSKVTVVEKLPRALPLEDPEISQEIRKQLERRGITIHTNASIRSFENNKATVELEKETIEIEADTLLSAVGRKPNTIQEKRGLETEKGFIKTNEFMQTNIENIYAIGDVVGNKMLAHTASEEGILAVEHIMGLEPEPLNYSKIPACVFTRPEVASIGLTEEQVSKPKVGKAPFMISGKARAMNEKDGFAKIVVDEKTDRIFGIHIIGPHASDLIAEAAAFLNEPLEKLIRTVHAHPTLAEVLHEAAMAAENRAIHK